MQKTIYELPAPVSLTIALLSDFHNGDLRCVTGVLRQDPPDLIAVAGDIFVGRKPHCNAPIFEIQKNPLTLLADCAAIAPTFFAPGNHDWVLSEDDRKAIGQLGVHVLDNRWMPYQVRGQQLLVGGLTSALAAEYWPYRRAYYAQHGTDDRYPVWDKKEWPETKLPDSAWLSEFEQEQGYKILLSHHPEYWACKEPYLRDHRIDLVLSGHAHGGQIRVGRRGLWAPGQGWLAGYVRGVFDGAYGHMAVSAGLANTARIIPRLGNPPEIVYLHLK